MPLDPPSIASLPSHSTKKNLGVTLYRHYTRFVSVEVEKVKVQCSQYVVIWYGPRQDLLCRDSIPCVGKSVEYYLLKPLLNWKVFFLHFSVELN